MIGQTPQPRQKKKKKHFFLQLHPSISISKTTPQLLLPARTVGVGTITERGRGGRSGHTKGPRWPDSVGKSGKYSSILLIRWNFAATAICRLDKCFFFLSPVLLQCKWSLVSRIYSRVFFVRLEHGFFFSFFLSGKILHPGFKIFDRPTFKIQRRDQNSAGRENHSIYHLWYINLTSPFSGRTCYLVMLNIVIFFSMVRVSLS